VRIAAPKIVAVWVARGAGALVATLVLFWLLARVGSLLGAVVARIAARLEKRGRGLGYRSVEVLSVDAILQLVRSAVGAVRVVVSLALVYLWILAVAWSLDAGRKVFPLVVSPFLGALGTLGSALVAFIPNLIVLVVILGVARFATRTVGLFADAVAEGRVNLPGLDRDLATPSRRLVNIGIWVLAMVMAVPYLPGSDSKAFQGIALFLGVLVSLGSTSVISNLLSGLVLTYSRAYRVGDRVKIGDVVGDVIGLGAFATRVRTTKDEEVVLPNAVVQSGTVVNYSSYAKQGGVQISTQVTIGYEAPWRTVHKLLIQAARSTPGMCKEPEPYVLQRALEDFFVRYEVRAWCDRANELHLVEGHLLERIQDEFAREGVEILSPHYEAKRDGGKSSIPEAMRRPPG
jgi:small-conductance mechanosensitive channel